MFQSASIMMYVVMPRKLEFLSLTTTKNLDNLEPHNLIPNGVWTLDGIMRYGEENKQCPYFTSRRMVYFPRLSAASMLT